MLTANQLGAELGRTSQSIRNHAEQLGVGTLIGTTLAFTPGEANRIRASINKCKRGRPLGSKNKKKPKGDAQQ